MIELCKDHTGKMDGMVSISTSITLNANCQKNQKIHGSICSHCYSQNMAKLYKSLDEKNMRNTEVLTSGIIPEEELPVIDTAKFPYLREEAFGDLNNITQLENYVNIAKKNPDTRVTLYSKGYKILLDYFKDHKCPDNMTIMVSSMFLNKPVNLNAFEATGAFAPGQLKRFTVYTAEYYKEHPEVKINCGARNCRACGRCYKKNKVVDVNEILKSDKNAFTWIEIARDPVKRKAFIDSIFKL